MSVDPNSVNNGIAPDDVRIFADHAKVPPEANQLIMINGFIVDCALVEEHTYDSEVTEYPVERGADITDNVRPKPIEVRIEGIVSNTPVSPDILAQRDSDVTPADEAYLRFMDIRDNREPVTIRTSLNTFENMVLKSLSIPRSKDTGDALRFTATFVQVEIVSNTRSTRVATPIAKKPKTATKVPTPVPDGAKPIKVILASETGVDPLKDRFWYDDDIGGWRTNATHDTPSKNGVPVGAIVGGAINPGLGVLATNGAGGAGEGWVVTKQRPFGASIKEWLTSLQIGNTDAYWKQRLLDAHNAAASSGASNQFDPWEAGGEVGELMLVQARRY